LTSLAARRKLTTIKELNWKATTQIIMKNQANKKDQQQQTIEQASLCPSNTLIPIVK